MKVKVKPGKHPKSKQRAEIQNCKKRYKIRNKQAQRQTNQEGRRDWNKRYKASRQQTGGKSNKVSYRNLSNKTENTVNHNIKNFKKLKDFKKNEANL